MSSSPELPNVSPACWAFCVPISFRFKETCGGQGELWARTGGTGEGEKMLWISHGPRGQGLKRWEGGGPVRVSMRQGREPEGAGLSRCEGGRCGCRRQAGSPRERKSALKPRGCFLLDGGIQTSASYSKSSSLSCETQGWKKVSLGELCVCSRLLTIS